MSRMVQGRYLSYSMVTAANDDRIFRVTANLTIPAEQAVRLFNERKVMTHKLDWISGEMRPVAMVVELEKTHIAVFSARDSEMVRGDGFVVFLPMEADHRHRPDAYVGGLIDAAVNGERVERATLEEVLAMASPVEAVAEFREAMVKFEART